MANKNNDLDDISVNKILCNVLLKSAVQAGVIDPTGMTDEGVVRAMRRHARDVIKKYDLQFVVDHRPGLLEKARLFKKDDEYNLACVMFATWTEHWVNGVIQNRSHALRFSPDEIKEVIRSVQIGGKITWLWKLLSLRPISRVHHIRIRDISDVRNSYVHYKWLGQSEEREGEATVRLRKAVDEYEKTVKYLQRWESENIMKTSTRRLRTIAQKHLPHHSLREVFEKSASPHKPAGGQIK